MQAATIERDNVSYPQNRNLGFERTGFIRTRRFSAVPGGAHHRDKSVSIASGTIQLDSPKSNASPIRATFDRQKNSSVPGQGALRRIILVYRAAVNSFVPAYATSDVEQPEQKRKETPMLDRLEKEL